MQDNDKMSYHSDSSNIFQNKRLDLILKFQMLYSDVYLTYI